MLFNLTRSSKSPASRRGGAESTVSTSRPAGVLRPGPAAPAQATGGGPSPQLEPGRGCDGSTLSAGGHLVVNFCVGTEKFTKVGTWQ